MFKFGILTSSDLGSQGLREDTSGQLIKKLFLDMGFKLTQYEVVPDEFNVISSKLSEWADNGSVDLIITTGGTGLGPRDIVPEATQSVVERFVPGISEAMRQHSLKYTNLAMLSRGVSGIRKNCLIINVPGNLKAVTECLEIVSETINHALEVLTKDRVDYHPRG